MGVGLAGGKKKQGGVGPYAWASWGAAVLRPYMSENAGSGDRAHREVALKLTPGGVNPAPTKESLR